MVAKTKTVKSVNPQLEWENAYSADGFYHKNEYPYAEVVSFVMRVFGNTSNKSEVKVLDLGCGWGNNLKFLKDKGFDYYGIDFSKTAVDHCQKNFKNVIHGDFSKLPYRDNFFNCAFDRQAIQCNTREAIKKIFSEIYRVLKPGGFFYSTFLAEADVEFHTTFLTEEELKKLLKSFSKVEIDYSTRSANNQTKFFKIHLIIAQK